MTLVWLVLGVATAYTLGEPRAVDLSFAASCEECETGGLFGLTIGMFADGPKLVATTASGMLILDMVSGESMEGPAIPLRMARMVRLAPAEAPVLMGCGPSGFGTLTERASGLALDLLNTDPCTDLASIEADVTHLVVTQIPAKGAVTGRFVPTPKGLVRQPLDELRHLVQSGDTVVGLTPTNEAVAVRVHGTEPLVEGRVVDVTALPPVDGVGQFGWLLDAQGGGPAVVLPDRRVALDLPVSGIISGLGSVFLLDAAQSRVGYLGDRGATFVAVPFVPELAVVGDLNMDGCPDLVVSSSFGEAALLEGGCEPIPTIALIPVPELITLGGSETPLLEARVGELIRTRVVLADGHSVRFAASGGPKGFTISRDGLIDYEVYQDDVGRYWVEVVGIDMLYRATVGFELRIWPSEVPSLDAAGEAEVAAFLSNGMRRETQLDLLDCRVSFGLAVGAAKAGGNTWENLGSRNVRGAASPIAAAACAIKLPDVRLLRPIVGLESAPYLRFGAVPDDLRYLIAVTGGIEFATENVRVGGFGALANSANGLGTRFAWMGLRDWRDQPMGVEARLFWVVPRLGGSVAVAWTWTL